MNLKNLLLAALGSGLLVSCGGRTGSPEGVVTVDFHDYVEKPLAELGDKFYTERRYVALHSDDSNLMIGDIGNVVLRGDKIYVNENGRGPNGRHVLVVHDSEGRAITKIGNKGRGPGEYLQISDFDVDTEGRIHIVDATYTVRKIFVYGPDGHLIEEKPLPFSINKLICTPDGGYQIVLATRQQSEDLNGRRFVKTDADLNVLNITGEWDASQIDENYILGNGCLVATPDGVFSQSAPYDNLYRLDADGNIAATWYLDLGPHAIPPEDRSNLGPLFESGLGKFRFFYDFVAPAGRYIFGAMSDRGVMKSFVYDLETATNYTLTPDETTPFEGFINISDGRLIGFFPYFDGETLPSDLPAELRGGVLGGDPLLVLYTLR